jgi:hypothetical protein
VQQHDLLVIERPVQRQQRLISTVKAHVRISRQARIQPGALRRGFGLAQPDRQPLPRLGNKQRQRGCLPDHGHHPVTQRQRLERDLTLRLGGQLAAAGGDRLTQRLPVGKCGVPVADELCGGDDVDVVAHRHDPADPSVDHLLSQRPVRPHPLMHITVPCNGVRFGGQVGVGRAARVEHQHRNTRACQRVAQRRTVDQLRIARRVSVFEQQIAVTARPGRGQQRVAQRIQAVQPPTRH